MRASPSSSFAAATAVTIVTLAGACALQTGGISTGLTGGAPASSSSTSASSGLGGFNPGSSSTTSSSGATSTSSSSGASTSSSAASSSSSAASSSSSSGLANGKGCTSASQCQSGFCEEKVCCDKACTTGCKTCSGMHSTTTAGTCGDVMAGQDVKMACSMGKCNGAGACACSDGMLSPGETDVDCGGPCANCPNGKKCGGNADCTSGHCVDTGNAAGKVCCDQDCGPKGPCYSCGQTAMMGQLSWVGSCLPVAVGMQGGCPPTQGCDPSGQCAGGQYDGASCASKNQCISGACPSGTCVPDSEPTGAPCLPGKDAWCKNGTCQTATNTCN